MSTPKYSFDPTMSNSGNIIYGEQHVITAVNFRDYHYVIPNFAPFFAESLIIKMQYPNGTTRPMIEGRDYYLGFQFMDASATTDHPIYGAISFLDTDTEGILTIDYHTVGGMWTLTPQQIQEILANNTRNPRITSWEQVVNPPERFPPINHPHDIVDFKTMTDVQEAVDRVRDAILANTGGGLAAHVGNFNNPHNVTKAQVLLGNVQNYAVATMSEAQAGTVNNKYMTPLRVKEAIETLSGEMLGLHAGRKDNPHEVSKAQVGLGSVGNYGIASSAEAVLGTSNVKYMTPLRVKEAMAALTGGFSNHLTDYDNPHRVSKDDVGLFLVENYAIATQQEARDGIATNKYMTPLRTTQLVAEYVYSQLGAHTNRTDNPHNVTKYQVGLDRVENFPLANVAEAQAGTANDRYMTPYLVKEALAALGGDATAHLSRTDNPHQVTKAQVGLSNVVNYGVATTPEAQAGVADNKYMTPVLVKEAINSLVGTSLNTHIGRTDNPHFTTALQVGLGSVQNYGIATKTEAEGGTVDNKYMTPLRVKEAINVLAVSALTSHTGNFNNPHQVTKAQVDLDQVQNYGIATTAEAQSGNSNNKYMTPLRVKEAVAGIISGGDVGNHITRTDNPHIVTKEQVGLGKVMNYDVATPAQVKNGASNALYLTPASLSDMRAEIATNLSSHTGRTDNPHNTSAAQVGAYSKSEIDTLLNGYLKTTGTAPNSILFNSRTDAQYATWLNNSSGVAWNATTLGGESKQQISDNILARVAGAYAPQEKMSRNGESTNSAEVTTTYWVKVHEIAYSNFFAQANRDGVAFVTGGNTSKPGVDFNIGQNAFILRTSARGSSAGAALVQCIMLTPSDLGSNIKVGYVRNTSTKKVTTYIQTRYDASDILVTELSNTAALVGDLVTSISATEPSGIIYVTPRNTFAELDATTTVANTAANDIALLTPRVAAIEALLSGITVS